MLCAALCGGGAVQASLISALDDMNTGLLATENPGSLGHATLTPTLGGTSNAGINIVPNRAAVAFDRRVVLGETTAQVAAEIVAMAETVVRDAQGITLTSNQLVDVGAFSIARDNPFVERLETISGHRAEIVAFGTNAPQYYPTQPSSNVRACVVMGPGSIDQAHQDEEYLEIAQLEEHRDVLAKWWGVSI